MRLMMLAVVTAVSLLLSGCATTGAKQKDIEIQRLNNQLSALNAQVQVKDEEIAGLKDELGRAHEQSVSAVDTEENREVKSRPTVKQIQKALKNAGYNPGSIDGKFGRQTREAIKDYQKANNLKPDGKVGKKTWKSLRKYL
ncbi:MAG: peptidoglycan-binding domain-containing protein [Candidatus Omnitrophica bacterium]|nr:peptidoglycan-binding domain-containing protein [Candidatus Omnitrophota bacterium]NLE91311.1 peptidoglycan-binding protein [Elusimicrobiota bacterium]